MEPAMLTKKLIDSSYVRPFYQDPSRVYHGMEHIHTLLDLIQEQDVNEDQRRFLVACAWLHDAFYDPRAGSPHNEETSCVFVDDERSGLTETGKELAKATILATAKHSQDQIKPHDLTGLFLDIDIMGLSGTYQDFIRHSQLISHEYRKAGFDDKELVAGHQKFFQTMNQRRFYFYTPKYEFLNDVVRDNLGRALKDSPQRFVQTDLIDDLINPPVKKVTPLK